MPPLLQALVDDAAMFPPRSAPLGEALPAHQAHLGAWYADLLGPLLVPASAVPRLVAALDAADGAPPGGDPLRVAVVADAGLDGLAPAYAALAAEPRLEAAWAEVALPAGSDLVSGAGEAIGVAFDAAPFLEFDLFVEVPRSPGWEEALDVLADSGSASAKLRTGGADAAAYPSEAELAAFLHACTARDLPFKLTAGLHRAVRHTDPDTGFEHHGFLNVLLAALDARDGADEESLARRLADRDAEQLAAAANAAAEERRGGWVSFGSCSVAEPLADLVELGLLDEG